MGRELEWKYRARPEQLRQLQEKYGTFERLEMETVYYDTRDGILGNRRWTLRRRMENGIPVCTVKTESRQGVRGEWEVVCDSIAEALPLLIAQGAPGELDALGKVPLVPVAGVRFTRLAKRLPAGEAQVELALDQGGFLGRTGELPFAEAEVEWKAGPEAQAQAFAGELSQAFGLVPEEKSKFRRALDAMAEGR